MIETLLQVLFCDKDQRIWSINMEYACMQIFKSQKQAQLGMYKY